MSITKKGEAKDIMSTIKPIEATPELCGKDAQGVLQQVSVKPTKQAIAKNEMLRNVLAGIRKE